jgi:hypothetical protein
MTAAGRVDFVIDQGADFTCQLVWSDFSDNPIPVATPMRMDVKSPFGQVMTTLFVPDPPLPEDEIPPITYNGDSGLIQIHLSKERTQAIPGGTYNYDLFVSVDDGEAYAGLQLTRLIFGSLICRSRTTLGI